MSSSAQDDVTGTRDALAILAVTARGGGEDCVPDETLLAWHEGVLPGPEAARVKHHVAHCDRCFELWCELCEALPRPTPAPSAIDRLKQGLSGRPGWQPLAVAAFVLVLGIGLGQQLMQSGPSARVAYELSFQGAATWRSSDDTAAEDRPVEVMSGDVLEILLRPATATDQSTAVRLFHVSGSARTVLPEPQVQPMGQGTLLMRITVGRDTALRDGEGALVVLAGRKGALPSIETALSTLGDRRDVDAGDWQAWRIPVHLSPPE